MLPYSSQHRQSEESPSLLKGSVGTKNHHHSSSGSRQRKAFTSGETDGFGREGIRALNGSNSIYNDAESTTTTSSRRGNNKSSISFFSFASLFRSSKSRGSGCCRGTSSSVLLLRQVLFLVILGTCLLTSLSGLLSKREVKTNVSPLPTTCIRSSSSSLADLSHPQNFIADGLVFGRGEGHEDGEDGQSSARREGHKSLLHSSEEQQRTHSGSTSSRNMILKEEQLVPPLVDQVILVVLDALRPDFVFPSLEPFIREGDHECARKDLFLAEARERPTTRPHLSHLYNMLINYPEDTLTTFLIADAPTTTSQRLKAIMTGTIPAFIEGGANFNSDEVIEDNILYQVSQRRAWERSRNTEESEEKESGKKKRLLREGGPHEGQQTDKRLSEKDLKTEREGRTTSQSAFPPAKSVRKDDAAAVVLGDDTWLSLFGDSYWQEHVVFPSFDVRDLDSNDEGVTRNMARVLGDYFESFNGRKGSDGEGGKRSSDPVLEVLEGHSEADAPFLGNVPSSLSRSLSPSQSPSLVSPQALESEGKQEHGGNEDEGERLYLPVSQFIPPRHAPLVIMHFLGLDHAGHSFNAYHPEMERKITEVNGQVKGLIDLLEKRHAGDVDNDPRPEEIHNRKKRKKKTTALIIMGDHGMTNSGDHGGDFSQETDTMAIMRIFRDASPTTGGGGQHVGVEPQEEEKEEPSRHSTLAHSFNTLKWTACLHDKSSRRRKGSDPHPTCRFLQCAEVVAHRSRSKEETSPLSPPSPSPPPISMSRIGAAYQIDIVPTLATLLGVGIPYSSMGSIIPEMVALAAEEHYCTSTSSSSSSSSTSTSSSIREDTKEEAEDEAVKEENKVGGRSFPPRSSNASAMAAESVLMAVRRNYNQIHTYLASENKISENEAKTVERPSSTMGDIKNNDNGHDQVTEEEEELLATAATSISYLDLRGVAASALESKDSLVASSSKELNVLFHTLTSAAKDDIAIIHLANSKSALMSINYLRSLAATASSVRRSRAQMKEDRIFVGAVCGLLWCIVALLWHVRQLSSDHESMIKCGVATLPERAREIAQQNPSAEYDAGRHSEDDNKVVAEEKGIFPSAAKRTTAQTASDNKPFVDFAIIIVIALVFLSAASVCVGILLDVTALTLVGCIVSVVSGVISIMSTTTNNATIASSIRRSCASPVAANSCLRVAFKGVAAIASPLYIVGLLLSIIRIIPPFSNSFVVFEDTIVQWLLCLVVTSILLFDAKKSSNKGAKRGRPQRWQKRMISSARKEGYTTRAATVSARTEEEEGGERTIRTTTTTRCEELSAESGDFLLGRGLGGRGSIEGARLHRVLAGFSLCGLCRVLMLFGVRSRRHHTHTVDALSPLDSHLQHNWAWDGSLKGSMGSVGAAGGGSSLGSTIFDLFYWHASSSSSPMGGDVRRVAVNYFALGQLTLRFMLNLLCVGGFFFSPFAKDRIHHRDRGHDRRRRFYRTMATFLLSILMTIVEHVPYAHHGVGLGGSLMMAVMAAVWLFAQVASNQRELSEEQAFERKENNKLTNGRGSKASSPRCLSPITPPFLLQCACALFLVWAATLSTTPSARLTASCAPFVVRLGAVVALPPTRSDREEKQNEEEGKEKGRATKVPRALSGAPDYGPLPALMFHLLGWVLFFASGQQTVLSTLDWGSAFVGVQSFNMVTCGALVVVRTFLPFLTSIIVPIVHSVVENDIEVTGNKGVAMVPLSLLTGMLMHHSMVTAASTLAAGVLRMHLMMWAIFCPKMLYDLIIWAAMGLVIVVVGGVMSTVNNVQCNGQTNSNSGRGASSLRWPSVVSWIFGRPIKGARAGDEGKLH